MMNVKKLKLENFKRFTDLEIDISSLETAPRLVLLVGKNGSGKSSVLDAINLMAIAASGKISDSDWDYFDKKRPCRISVEFEHPAYGRDRETFGHFENRKNGTTYRFQNAFYGRSAFRMAPVITTPSYQVEAVSEDVDRPPRFIDHDDRFLLDIQLTIRRVLAEVFTGPNLDVEGLRQKFIEPINLSFLRIFGETNGTALRLISIIPNTDPTGPPNILFSKGESEIPYYMLSSGEKEVFNIILNLFVRRDAYPEAIYYMDELDSHLHTSLQFSLIKDIVENWLPEKSQLWTASHSLGFIDYANQSDQAAIVDFEDLDFDKPQRLLASLPNAEVFEVAVPSDSALQVFPNRKLVLCENKNAELYNRMGLKDYLFVKSRDKNSVFNHSRSDAPFLGLIDRDFLSDEELEDLQKRYGFLRILPCYSLENLLYHPENITELAPASFRKGEYLDALEIVRAAREKRLLMRLRETRNSYELLKDFKKDDKHAAADEIGDRLRSSSFDDFYPFLSMKDYRPTAYLGPLNLNPQKLAETAWIRAQVLQVLAT